MNRKNKRKQLIYLIIAIVLVIGLGFKGFEITKAVDEIKVQKNLMIASDGLSFIKKPAMAPNDSTAWSGDYLHFGLTTTNKWRIFEHSGNTLMLYSDNYLPVFLQKFDTTSNVYESSDIRNFLITNGIYSAFPDTRELNCVVASNVPAKPNTEFNSDDSLVVTDWEDGGTITAATTVSFTNPAVNGDKLYLLSVDEMTNPNYGFYRSGRGNNASRKSPSDERYWLRSGYVDDSTYPALMDCWPNGGTIQKNYECDGAFYVMAACHIDTSNVLYVSSSVNGKVSGAYGADALTEVSDASFSDFKFTLKDTNLKLTLSNTKRTNNTFSFDYQATGAANNISAMLFDSDGNVVSYGRIKDISATANKAGSATVNVPADYDTKGYTLKVFPEQYKGDNATDYAGETTVVTGDVVVDKYEVTFKNYNGDVLKKETVDSQGAATAPEAPKRDGHTFTGWDVPFDNITQNLEVIAQFTTNKYEVTFKNYNGDVLKKETVEYQGTATAPTVPKRDGYTFTGWDVPFDNITQNLEVVAQFVQAPTSKYEVIFKNYNGDVLKKETVDYQGIASAPEVPERKGYTFAGWNVPFDNITHNLEVIAKFTINKYEVTFKNYNGDILKKETVEYQGIASAPIVPDREGYTFTGWDKDIFNITSNVEITALYIENEKMPSTPGNSNFTDLKPEEVEDTVVYTNDYTNVTVVCELLVCSILLAVVLIKNR